ncbi:MAG: Sec-independent protein translocase protein TatB [Thermodesulfobacteriota bacterium]
MFGIGSTELVVILVVAIIVIGPSKLPKMARGVGKAFGEFKRASNDLKRTIDHEVERIERDEKTKKAKAELLPEDAPAAKPAASAEAAAPPAAPAAAPAAAPDKDKA